MEKRSTFIASILWIAALSYSTYVYADESHTVDVSKDPKVGLKISTGEIFIFRKLDAGFGIQLKAENENVYWLNNRHLSVNTLIVNTEETDYSLTIENKENGNFIYVTVICKEKTVRQPVIHSERKGNKPAESKPKEEKRRTNPNQENIKQEGTEKATPPTNENDQSSTFVQKDEIPWDLFVLTGLAGIILIAGMCYYLGAYKKHIRKKKEEKRREEEIRSNNTIRKRVTTYMKYPSGLDEVKALVGTEYYEMDLTLEQFQDSCVGKIYFHRKCIEELYRFFSGMLKDSDKLKEGGCYLLGRWELAGDQYHVSYEQLVMPGDDAIYKEYELNFGAKIGIRMGTALSTLRETTNKQYVLTAWLHTHPGLGIFLSSQDTIVQSQLMDSVYRNRLTAVVVDVLTPELNFAVFSAKRDGRMNNQADLKKELSFEKLYAWAKNRKPAAPVIDDKDYYNILSPEYAGNSLLASIRLNNECIIDMETVNLMESEFSGYFEGYIQDNNKLYLQRLINPGQLERMDTKNIKGCLAAVDTFNYRSIMDKINKMILKPLFILVHQRNNDTVFCITLLDTGAYSPCEFPCTAILYSDLKKWTRRKR